MYLPSAVTKQPQIDAVVDQVKGELAGEVVQIRYSIDTDWSGDWAIFFRIVLTDNAARGKRLKTTPSKIRDSLLEKLKPLELGLFPYFNFRSRSEQAALREEAWA